MSQPSAPDSGSLRSTAYLSASPDGDGMEETVVQEVRYSLPRLLHELRLERRSSLFAKEILDQSEISRLFGPRRPAHGKSPKR